MPVLHSCRVAFPLDMLSRLKFSLVLRFRVFGGVYIGEKPLNAIISDFRAVSGCDCLSLSRSVRPLVPVLRSVMCSGVALVPSVRVYPPLLYMRARMRGVTSTLTIKKTF